MFQPLYTDSYNGSQYNFTEPFNSTMGDIENTNASRHFADQPQPAANTETEWDQMDHKRNLTSSSHEANPGNNLERRQFKMYIFHAVPLMAIYILSIVPCGLIIIGGLLWFHDCKTSRRMQRSSRTETNDEGGIAGSCRPDLLSVIQNGAADQMMFQNGDEIPIIDTPSSIYPSDMLPNFSDSSRNLCSDTITTPLSNNSIITMTMRNNYLIVETEERVPVNCSLLTSEELYANNVQNISAFMNAESDDYQPSDLLDDLSNYSEDQNHPNLCTVSGEERRPFYEPTSSRQADEEDQHVELFHKNLLVFPNSSYEQETDTVPSCSYDYNEERTSASSNGGANTGLTQSDLTGSSSSTSRRARIDYGYSNQCEYLPSEISQRKRSSSLKLLSCDKREILATSVSLSFPRNSPEDSVLQVTDCSSPEFSEPSK